MANAPSFPETAQLKPVFATLKQRVASFQPLLVHRIDDDCFLAVYETGCFWLSRRGVVAKAGVSPSASPPRASRRAPG